MLVIVMTLGEVLFNSRAVGRLGSLLFFFFGSLSYVPFLQKQASVRAAIEAITHQRDYLQTIFPYRGEAWGTWSQVTYLNQLHFATAIGIFLLVLLFLVIRYRAVAAKRAEARASANTTIAQRGESPDTGSMPITEPGKSPDTGSMPVTVNQGALEDIREPQAEVPAVAAVTEPSPETRITREPFLATLPPFIFSGVFLGLLPMFNSAVFLTAAAVLGLLFILFPLRLQMMALAITAGLIALPQMLYLSTGSGRTPMPRLLRWGYTLDHPTVANVTKYLGFTFGFKWVLIALALVFATSLQRRFFLAFLSLIAVAFSFQFTIEVLANQKFIHIWVIIANLFVAFALWRLWRFSLGGTTLPGKFVATVLFLLVIPGGIIDFFPINNPGWSEVTYRNDALIDWLKKNTSPRDIFLTDRFVTHPILMAGRRVFYGWPYYAWSAGYDAAVRQAQFIKRPNEQLYATYFPKVFEDSRINGLVIYKVPDTPPPQL